MASAPTGVSRRTDLSIDRSDSASSHHVTTFDHWLAAAVQRTIADGPVRLERPDDVVKQNSLDSIEHVVRARLLEQPVSQ